ncbi:hypothetical protein N7478_012240 [Penicillium angulare]|uniref:uncharacterized protein n=1 Tax=Penicillium angulare TaxID=116970 RepID=UPI0025410CB5|nr:uncharacterized protein N7478_012240 [Penicillium angulare]KAJ5259259.1 hypothetical protein N7478_012240 [Penicillium angulare]
MHVLGNGNTAVVLLRDGIAIKTPLRWPWSSDSDVEVNRESIKREQKVYPRLQDSDDYGSSGIVRCIECSSENTQLALMPNGDLRTYLSKHQPSCELQLSWFCQMAQTLSYIHDRSVLVADIASRNLLFDSDLSMEFCDFSEASLLPLDSDMEAVDNLGYTTQVDIGFLGAVFYEVVTGIKCDINLFEHNDPTDGRDYWPDRSGLHPTQDIWLGRIIEGCWDGTFRAAHSLLEAFSAVESPYM